MCSQPINNKELTSFSLRISLFSILLLLPLYTLSHTLYVLTAINPLLYSHSSPLLHPVLEMNFKNPSTKQLFLMGTSKYETNMLALDFIKHDGGAHCSG
jgi:hypothetical protein